MKGKKVETSFVQFSCHSYSNLMYSTLEALAFVCYNIMVTVMVYYSHGVWRS